ncbi:PH domain-containing protein [Actinospica robiniae]|uniref:PH domain-containing protein n=1 Tax=Actinospica robiniae TaxID=304901 RepID=UPI0012F9F01D|nr:PH domain-containing protein [Actinospica robiniae]
MTSPATSPGSAEKPTVYRGVGALIGGALVTLFCLGGAIDLLVEEGGADLVGAAVLVLVAVLAFAFGVYPAAFAREDGLVVRNPLRTITVPWPAVTKLVARLSFEVHTEQSRYTVWAVPVSLRDRRKAERARLRERVRNERELSRGRRNASYGVDQGPPRRGGGFEDVEKLSFADQAVTEMNERIERHRELEKNRPGAQPAAAARPSLVTLVPLAAAVVFLIVAAIVR